MKPIPKPSDDSVTALTVLSVRAIPRLLLLLAMTSIGGCAQIEMHRLQGEVDELQAQLAYQKQRLKQATELADSNPHQPAKQRTSAKACKPHPKKGVATRSSNCVSGRKCVK